MTCSNRIFEMSYMYISVSSTMTSVLRFSLTANIDDGNNSSHIIDWRYEEMSTRYLGYSGGEPWC